MRLRRCFVRTPALLERTVQIGQGLATIALRAAAFIAKHAEVLAAARQQVGRMLQPILLRAEHLQSFPNFPPRLSLVAPLGQISARSFSLEPISAGNEGNRPSTQAEEPDLGARIAETLRSRREKGYETRMQLRFEIRQTFPKARDLDFGLAYSEVYQHKRRGRPRKNI